jgi:ribosomal protein S13
VRSAANVEKEMLSEVRETVAELAEVKEPRGMERESQQRVGGGDRKTVERAPRAAARNGKGG